MNWATTPFVLVDLHKLMLTTLVPPHVGQTAAVLKASPPPSALNKIFKREA